MIFGVNMNLNLLFQGLKKFGLGLIAIGILLFVPAGTLNYPNGWLFIALLFVPMLMVGIILITKAPDLFKKRLNANETQKEQKIVLLISLMMFVSSFIVAGVNFRFKLTQLQDIVVMVACVIFLIAYLMYMEVLRENEYLSRNVEVTENQKVIDTGLYGIVRHPMYTSTVFLFLSMPLILGSIYSFIIMLIYPIIIEFRIKNEEKILESELEGYEEYKNKVKYKIFPFIW